MAAEHEGPIDLLLTDIHMPGMSGLRLAAELGSRRPNTRVLFMSGSGATLGSEIAALVKPFTLAQLTKALRDVLER